MDMTSMALSSLDMASSAAMMNYSIGVTKRAMSDEITSEKKMLEDMLPPMKMISARPQPGDTPAIRRGNFVDVYA